MPRLVPYSAACALVPASLMGAPTPDAALQITAEEALLRAAVDAALLGEGKERESDDESVPMTLKARRVGRVAHVLAALPDGRATSLLFRFDGQAWRRIAKAS